MKARLVRMTGAIAELCDRVFYEVSLRFFPKRPFLLDLIPLRQKRRGFSPVASRRGGVRPGCPAVGGAIKPPKGEFHPYLEG